MAEYFKIGKLAASMGLKGELILQHSLGKKTDFSALKAIFLEDKKDSFLPYFIERAVVKSDEETIIKLEGIDVMEVARKMTPKEVWLLEADFKKFADASAPISMLGFHLVDGGNDLGKIIEVIEQPHQILCTIMYNGKEALIPVHQENLIKLDRKNEKVHVEIPAGLLEIYG